MDPRVRRMVTRLAIWIVALLAGFVVAGATGNEVAGGAVFVVGVVAGLLVT